MFSKNPGVGSSMDKAIQLAVELQGLEVPLDTNFFAQIEAYRTGVMNKAVFKCRQNTNEVQLTCAMLKFEYEGDEATHVPHKQTPAEIRQLFTKSTSIADTEAKMEKESLPKCHEQHISLVKGLHALTIKSLRNAELPHVYVGAQAALAADPGLCAARAAMLAADPTTSKAHVAHEAVGRLGVQKSIEVSPVSSFCLTACESEHY